MTTIKKLIGLLTGKVHIAKHLMNFGNPPALSDTIKVFSEALRQPLRYVALFTQTGTAAPTVKKYDGTTSGTQVNDIGTLTWSRISAGRYKAAIPTGVTGYVISKYVPLSADGTKVAEIYSDSSDIFVRTYNEGSTADELMTNTPLTIEFIQNVTE